MRSTNFDKYLDPNAGRSWTQRWRDFVPADIDTAFLVLVFVLPLCVALLLGRGALGPGLGLAVAASALIFGAVLIRRVPLEGLIALLMLPLILVFPASKSNVGGLSGFNSIRVFDILLLFGLFYLNQSRNELQPATLRTWVFRGLTCLLMLATGLSALFGRDQISDPFGIWQTGPLLVLAASFLATFISSPRLLFERMAEAARPAAFVLCAIALVEYALNSSLFGMVLRSHGFDRRVPGPFYAAEVFGYMFSILAALILFHSRQVRRPGARAFNTLALLACALGAFLTFFRSSWLSVLAVIAVDLLLHLPNRRRVVRALPWLPFLLPLVAFFAVGFTYTLGSGTLTNTPFWAAVTERFGGDAAQNSAGNRDSFAQSAYLMIQESPLTGVGFFMYPINMMRFIPADLDPAQFRAVFQSVGATTEFGNVAHNSILQVVAEMGIPIGIIFVVLIAYPVAALWWQRKRQGQYEYFALAAMLTAGLLASYTSQSMFYYGPAALIWAYLLFGALVRQADNEPSWVWDDVSMPLVPVIPEEDSGKSTNA